MRDAGSNQAEVEEPDFKEEICRCPQRDAVGHGDPWRLSPLVILGHVPHIAEVEKKRSVASEQQHSTCQSDDA